MSAAVSLDVRYEERRRRASNAFRMILAFPHMIVLAAWGHLAGAVALIQWFHILFTGRRNRGLWRVHDLHLAYATRTSAYTMLLNDAFPQFVEDPDEHWVRYRHEHVERADKLRTGLRFIWVIPAAVIFIGISIATMVLLVVTWFGILFTGRQGRGIFDFLVTSLRFGQNVTAYMYLMTDEYPRWGRGAIEPPEAWPPLPTRDALDDAA